MLTHYDTLEVTQTASPEVIRGAYRYLCQKWHPDKHNNDRTVSEDKLKSINEAYRVLSDPVLRSRYDEYLSRYQVKTESDVKNSAKPDNPGSRNIDSGEPPIGGDRADEMALWNPAAAVNWSLLFSPIFGAFLQSKNWSALGEFRRAKRSMYWIYAGALIAFVVVLISEGHSPVAQGLSFWYLILWYFISGRAQIGYIKERFGKTYKKKTWSVPLVAATVGVIGYAIVLSIVANDGSVTNQKNTVKAEPIVSSSSPTAGTQSKQIPSPQVVSPKWVFFTKSKSGTDAFFDETRIRSSGDVHMVWIKYVPPQHTEKGAGTAANKWLESVQLSYEFDCRRVMVRATGSLANFEDGTHTLEDNSSSAWEPVRPEMLIVNLMNSVCMANAS